MRETTPKVYLIASPQIHWEALSEYVGSVGGSKWTERRLSEWKDGASDGEILVEGSGRMCYRSWDAGLNVNVTKVREDSEAYFENLLKSGHGSVLEHANYSFIFQDVSRVFTHELVRHRAGVAISQESLRYVRLTDIPFRVPKELATVLSAEEIARLLEHMELVQQKAGLVLDQLALPMPEKKMLTSAMRRLAPLGLSTAITWTANIRTLRHVIKMRTAPDAEEEMRLVFAEVGKIMLKECPLLFQDFEIRSDGAFVPKYVKV